MNKHPAEFEIREYRGREQGLMVIGTAEALRALGAQLAAVPERAVSGEWPDLVASAAVRGPYADTSEYRLSFHIQPAGEVPLKLPLLGRGPSAFVVVPVLAFALAGVFFTVRAVAHAF
jgi:hypothetical protein